MAYLLDSNTLIEAKNHYYGFALCPGFWDWLEQQNNVRTVFSLDRVESELRAIQDELAEWASDRGNGFFLEFDALASSAMNRVALAVRQGGFRDHAVNAFMGSADPFLIAYALAHDHTVVTHEVHIEGRVRKVSIPTICQHLNVPCLRTFDMLRKEQASFVLAS